MTLTTPSIFQREGDARSEHTGLGPHARRGVHHEPLVEGDRDRRRGGARGGDLKAGLVRCVTRTKIILEAFAGTEEVAYESVTDESAFGETLNSASPYKQPSLHSGGTLSSVLASESGEFPGDEPRFPWIQGA